MFNRNNFLSLLALILTNTRSASLPTSTYVKPAQLTESDYTAMFKAQAKRDRKANKQKRLLSKE